MTELGISKKSNAFFWVTLVAVTGVLAVSHWMMDGSTRQIDRAYAETRARYAAAAFEIELSQQAENAQRKVATDAQLSVAMQEKVPRSAVLAEITNALPEGASLLTVELNGTSNGTVRIKGTATSAEQASGIREHFSNSKLFREVAHTQAEDAGAFNIEMKIDSTGYSKGVRQ